MCRGCLPTHVRLQDKGVQCPLDCVTCEGPLEDIQHVFFDCTFAVQVWIRVGLWSEVQHAYNHGSSADVSIFLLLQKLSRVQSQQFAALLWSLWKHRNLRLWQGENETIAHVVNRAQYLMEDWNLANTPTAEVHRSSSEVQNSREDMYNSRTDPNSSTTVARSRTTADFNITYAHDSIADVHSSSMNAQGAAAPSTSSVSTLIGQRRHPGMFPS